jgi:hypothetical protein
MAGTVMSPYKKTGEARTQRVPYPTTWNASIRDSLRGKFKLKRVLALVGFEMAMPEGAGMDTFQVRFDIWDPANPATVARRTSVLKHLKNDTTYLDSVDITNIVNLFPDSLTIQAYSTVPAGTRILIVNDLQQFGQNTGGMGMNGYVNFRLKPYLDWEVESLATMDLGSGRVEIGSGMRYFGKMSERAASFNIGVENHTNVNIRLTALMAPNMGRKKLDSISTNQISNLLAVEGRAEAAGYVNLLGPDGVVIPPRGQFEDNAVQLSEQQIGMILDADTAAWRWILQFMEKPREALLDTDYIFIKSWIHFEGVNNMDSVFIWH